MISETNIERTKKLIKTAKKKPIIVKAQDDAYNRKLLEYGKFQILLSPEAGSRKNTIRQIDSGFNHVLAKIASKNSVSIGIDIADISKLVKKQKAKRLTKIRQNIKICRKAKTKIKIINSEDMRSAMSLLSTLGASSSQIKEAISF